MEDESKKGVIGTRSCRLARGFAEWMSRSQVTQRAAASALQVKWAGACSQTSQTGTRAWREASLFAAWILESQLMHRKAESARQNNVAVADLHESQSFEAIEEEEEEEEYEGFKLLFCSVVPSSKK